MLMALSYHGTEGSSLTDYCSVTIQRSESTRQLIASGVRRKPPKKIHRLPGNVKWVWPHGVGCSHTVSTVYAGSTLLASYPGPFTRAVRAGSDMRAWVRG